jgi:O-antigen ligase
LPSDVIVDKAAKLARLRAIAAFLVGLTIPLSVSVSEILTGLAFLLLLIDWQPQAYWRRIRGNPVAWASLGLFLLLGVGVIYSAAPLHEATRFWLKYRELVYLPLFLLLCRDRQVARAGLAGLVCAMAMVFVLGMLLLLNHFRPAPGPHPYYALFGSYIIQGVVMALSAYYFAVEAIVNPRRRLVCSLIAGLALFFVLFINPGRTGYAVALALALLLLFQAVPRRWLAPGVLAILLAVAGTFLASPNFANRLSGIVTGLQGSHEDAAASSAGARMRFYRGSLVVIGRHPIFGTGTGSFTHVYNDQAAIDNNAVTSNPHNEYLMIGVQTGIVGVGALLILLGTLWLQAARLPQPEAWCGRAVTLALAISCLFNSSLMDHVDGQVFAFQIGLFFWGIGGREDQRHHNHV